MKNDSLIQSKAQDIGKIIEREIALLNSPEKNSGDAMNRECSTIPCAYLGKNINGSELVRECSTIPCAYLGSKKETETLMRECATIPCAYLGKK
ncbi:MAG: hypothetical protein KKF46_01425 [Nanoarchaeota archaeon]|nr:hypothetical protein [Nanoarchaeota archaeon]MBU1320994.1 hypothetical protein [Nanoarchaeota archaeon]MBU1596865.1 hypothetical protein [Nanoarchaeota archaeon]MBU2440796.1 hypothetical protein [Nanoarchaeota archaeon]